MPRAQTARRLLRLLPALLVALPAAAARGDVSLPAIFGDHMVLQRDQKDRVWGKAAAGEEITVAINGQSKTAKAGDDGKWSVTLDPMSAGGPYTLTVRGKNTVTCDDVLVGEVWLCSGQSNMELPLIAANDGDVEALAANFPKIRLISVPQRGTQEPQDDFRGHWDVCTPSTVKSFSAIGFLFGRQLHQTLGVPVGLIDDAWGGSACEAWVRRDLLADNPKLKGLMDRWEKIEKEYPQRKEEFPKKLAEWEKAAAAARSAGKQPPPRPFDPEGQMRGNARPGNIYNGVLKPTIGYGIRGAIWYQGETNAGRAYQYRELFPFMIKTWRDEWGIGDFPFYWVQLADYQPEKAEPGDSAWAELREAQTMTMDRLPRTGQAVIIDIGEGKDIHPRNKQDVATRLARWALAREYGVELPYKSPTYRDMKVDGKRVTLNFADVPGGLRTFDVNEVRGFTIAGKDRKFVRAKAEIVGKNKDQVEVWSDEVDEPVAVRYAWADNPVCNLYSRAGLPVTPFRTDDWPGVTADKE